MVWVKLDDGFADHPKIARVGDRGLAMFVRGLCYCNRHLTDGDIPAEIAHKIGHPQTAKALVDAGLWIVKGTGFAVHDFDKFNPPRESVLRKRKAAQDRKIKWKERQEERRRNGVPNAGRNGDGTLPPNPYPSPTPTLLRSVGGREGDGACAPAERRAAPGKERIAAAITTACRIGLHEDRVRDMIDAHGVDAVERANAVGLKFPVKIDAVDAWFGAVKGGAA